MLVVLWLIEIGVGTLTALLSFRLIRSPNRFMRLIGWTGVILMVLNCTKAIWISIGLLAERRMSFTASVVTAVIAASMALVILRFAFLAKALGPRRAPRGEPKLVKTIPTVHEAKAE